MCKNANLIPRLKNVVTIGNEKTKLLRVALSSDDKRLSGISFKSL